MEEADACDEGLMLRVREGDRAAFAELLERYEVRLMNVLRGMVGDEAEDLFQEVFLRVWRSRERYEPTAPFRAWLFTIARNAARNAAAKKRPSVGLDRVPEPSARSEPDPVEVSEEILHVRGLLAELPDDQREALLLRIYEGMPYAEIARTMGAPRGTVAWWIHEGLATLGRRLGPGARPTAGGEAAS